MKKKSKKLKDQPPGMPYGPEVVVAMSPSCRLQVRVPEFPLPCSYVRVVECNSDAFVECAYWDSAEWGEEPADAMGAIMGAIIAVNSGTFILGHPGHAFPGG